MLAALDEALNIEQRIPHRTVRRSGIVEDDLRLLVHSLGGELAGARGVSLRKPLAPFRKVLLFQELFIELDRLPEVAEPHCLKGPNRGSTRSVDKEVLLQIAGHARTTHCVNPKLRALACCRHDFGKHRAGELGSLILTLTRPKPQLQSGCCPYRVRGIRV